MPSEDGHSVTACQRNSCRLRIGLLECGVVATIDLAADCEKENAILVLHIRPCRRRFQRDVLLLAKMLVALISIEPP